METKPNKVENEESDWIKVVTKFYLIRSLKIKI